MSPLDPLGRLAARRSCRTLVQGPRTVTMRAFCDALVEEPSTKSRQRGSPQRRALIEETSAQSPHRGALIEEHSPKSCRREALSEESSSKSHRRRALIEEPSSKKPQRSSQRGALIEWPSSSSPLNKEASAKPSTRSPQRGALIKVPSAKASARSQLCNPIFPYVKMARIDQKSNACGGGYERHGTGPCSEKVPGASV